MMARRLLLTADAPQQPARKARGKAQLHRRHGAARRSAAARYRSSSTAQFNPEDLDTVRRLKDALAELPGYRFRYLDNHKTLERDLAELRTDLVLNLCDEGLNNDPFKELHVPAMLERDRAALHRRGAGARSARATTRASCARWR